MENLLILEEKKFLVEIYKKNFTLVMSEENLQLKIYKQKFTPVLFEEKFQMKIYNTIQIALKTDSDTKYKSAYKITLSSRKIDTCVYGVIHAKVC